MGVGACTRCAVVGVGLAHWATHIYMALRPITTSTRLYLRVVKLDTNLRRRLSERPITIKHSFRALPDAGEEASQIRSMRVSETTFLDGIRQLDEKEVVSKPSRRGAEHSFGYRAAHS